MSIPVDTIVGIVASVSESIAAYMEKAKTSKEAIIELSKRLFDCEKKLSSIRSEFERREEVMKIEYNEKIRFLEFTIKNNSGET